MKKTLSLAAAATLVAACSSSLDPNAVRGALPSAGAVQLGTPAATSSGATALRAPALVELDSLAVNAQALGETPSYKSEYAVTSYWTAVTVNVGVWWTLTLVDVITRLRPTSCDESSCTWGPWVDDDGLNRWKLHVEKQDGGYAYVLSGQNGVQGGDFVPLVSGVAYPGPDRDHGKGSFSIDFDAQDALAHGPLWQKGDFGKLDVQYDTLAAVSIDVVLRNGRNNDPANPVFMNAVYAFDATRGAGGELQVAFENLTTTEIASLRTRWDGAGAGRSDAQYSGQDGVLGNGDDLYASECWAGEALGFVERYDSKIAIGSEALDCAFNPARYADVVLP